MMQSEVLTVVLAWLGTYLLHSTLLLGGAWLATRTRLLAAPHLAERVWRLALLGGIVSASLQVGLGTRPLLGSLSLHRDAPPLVAAAWPATDPAAQPQGGPGPTTEGVAELPPAQRPLGSSAGRDPGSNQSPSTARVQRAVRRTDLTPPAPRSSSGARRLEARDEHGPRAPTSEERGAPRHANRERSSGTGSTASALPENPLKAIRLQAVETLRRLPWRDGLLALWLGIGGLGLAGFLWAAAQLPRLLADKRQIVDGPLFERLMLLCRSAGTRERVRLYASRTLASPITYGWIGRKICVPVRVLTDLTPSQQSSLLAHELAHALRRDPLWFSVYTLLERVLFVQPLNRVARRHLHDSAELLCDDWAVRWTGGRLALASCLTEIAQWIVGGTQPALPSPGMAAKPSHLGVRVVRLLDDDRLPQPQRSHRWWSPTATTALALFVFAVPGVSSSHRPEPAPAPAPMPEPVPEPEPKVDPAPPEPHGLTLDSEVLAEDLQLLDTELAELRAELRRTKHYGRFERALSQLEARIESLHDRRELLTALLERLAPILASHPDHEPSSHPIAKD